MRGAIAAISIGATTDDFLEVIEAALTGHIADSRVAHEAEEDARLGREVGLTLRQAEVLARIVRGMSNQEIGEDLHVTTNTVKSYIRSAYRKMERDQPLPGCEVGRAARLPARHGHRHLETYGCVADRTARLSVSSDSRP